MEKSLESSRVRPESEMLPQRHGLDRFSFLTINRNGIRERAESMTGLARCWTDIILTEMREGERKSPCCLSRRS